MEHSGMDIDIFPMHIVQCYKSIEKFLGNATQRQEYMNSYLHIEL